MSNKSDNTPAIGAHYSVAHGFAGAFSDAHTDGASAMQIFAKSPMQAKLRKVTAEESSGVSSLPFRDTIKTVVIHSSYLLNLAKPESEKSFSLTSLAEDIRNSDALGAQGVVLHMGKTLGMDPKDAEDNFIKNIATVLVKTADCTSPILIENTAGQGTEMSADISDFARFLKRFHSEKRVRVCLDTAHLFGAGNTLSEIGDKIGFEKIVCIHLNDSKKTFGSHTDRHADIGTGEIGEKTLRDFCMDVHKHSPHTAFILETPQDTSDFKNQIEKVKSWFD